ncbi:DUF4157 domain-containing protein [Nostoc sp. C117]|uniref:eCIS core domain-containing protein n=1 Tax=Nostoc sp. C117 TaxID=3349875 RepID=UPI00370DDDFE
MHKTKSSKTDSSTYSNSLALNSSPQLAHRPFGSEIQKASVAAKTPTDIENEGFAEQQIEATQLEIQAKSGSITPEGQERLTVLQAKMDGLLNSRLSHARRFGHNIANIPLIKPETPTPIQAKLTIGEPGDKYEQEADETGRQVVQKIHHPQSEKLQRESFSEEEKELQMKAEHNIQCEALPEEEDELQMKPEGSIQRELLPEEKEELQMKPMVQRLADGGMAASPDLETSILQARGGGQLIADNIRESMEQAFGVDFSGVSVHTDSQSDQLNRSIQARAFTTGQDVFFRRGQYNPGSRAGQELLAHELTHVVQQNGGAVRRSLFSSPQQLPTSLIQTKSTMEQPNDKYKSPRVAQIQKRSNETLSAQSDSTNVSYGQSVQLNIHRSAPVLQRKLMFTGSNETFTDIQQFLMAYGVGKYAPGVKQCLEQINKLIEEGEHTKDNIDVLLSELGYVEVENNEKVKFLVNAVIDSIGDLGVTVKENITISGIKSKKESSHPLYEVKIEGKQFMLKKEQNDKSEFMGMQEMKKQGIKVPAAMSLITDQGEYILMEYIKELGVGLGTMNKFDKDIMKGSAESLGKMHTTDIMIGNVDRLPWCGNNYTGHWNNVFTDLLTKRVIGIDSEKTMNFQSGLLKDIRKELNEIKDNPEIYANKIYELLSTSSNKDKLDLGEEEAQVFITYFASGLKSALPPNIDDFVSQKEVEDEKAYDDLEKRLAALKSN